MPGSSTARRYLCRRSSDLRSSYISRQSALQLRLCNIEGNCVHNPWRQTNLSCLLYGPKDARFEQRPDPIIEDPHDVLVRISYVGVCGSDVHFWLHGGMIRKVSENAPLVMGHEASGVIYKVGSAVTSVNVGDQVAIEPGFPCRRCNRCKAGRYNLCPTMRFAADPPDTHGTLCRVFKVPEACVYKLPSSISLQEAVLVEPLSVAIHGVRLAKIKPGQSVLVLGSGTIGLLSAATARAYGADSVILLDINKDKLDFASSFVQCTTFVPSLESAPRDEAERLKQVLNVPDGLDVVLECTGVEASIQTGLYACTVGGVFVQVGLGKSHQTLPLGEMCEKEIVIRTSFRYGPGDYEIALSLIQSGKISVKSLITSIMPFESAPEAWEQTRRGQGIKTLIEGVQH